MSRATKVFVASEEKQADEVLESIDPRRREELDVESEAEVVYAASGSIFGDTSLIEDALLREAIGGRFRV